MINLNDAVKKPFEQLQPLEQQYLTDTFREYIIRSEIADNNKILSSLFYRNYNDAKDISMYFRSFNNHFFNYNPISYLTYNEASTNLLKNMSEEDFNIRLKEAISPKEQAALIQFSLRPNESLVNRLDYLPLIAYADMQNRAIENIRDKKMDIEAGIASASRVTRERFKKKFNKEVNEYRLMGETIKFARPSKNKAKLWINMINFNKQNLCKNDPIKIFEYFQNIFAPTNKCRANIRERLNKASNDTKSQVQSMTDKLSNELTSNKDSMTSYLENQTRVGENVSIKSITEYFEKKQSKQLKSQKVVVSPAEEAEIYRKNLRGVIVSYLNTLSNDLLPYIKDIKTPSKQ